MTYREWLAEFERASALEPKAAAEAMLALVQNITQIEQSLGDERPLRDSAYSQPLSAAAMYLKAAGDYTQSAALSERLAQVQRDQLKAVRDDLSFNLGQAALCLFAAGQQERAAELGEEALSTFGGHIPECSSWVEDLLRELRTVRARTA